MLGASAGLKHFGTRRLGRSGLSVYPPTGKDNVWQVDCSSFFPASTSSMEIHGAYFDTKATIDLMRDILRGLDRRCSTLSGAPKALRGPELYRAGRFAMAMSPR